MKLTIEYKNSSPNYTGGQGISGTVTAESQEEEKTTGLVLICTGFANSSWMGTYHNGRRNSHDDGVHYAGHEKYFEFKQILAGQEDESAFVLEKGKRTYPFKFVLPQKLPPSFKGTAGSIEYHCEVSLKRPGLRPPTITRAPFIVITQLDMNRFPAAIQPVDIQNEKYLCCLCCKSGPLGMKLHLERSGYAVGESLDFLVYFKNQTSRKIQSTKAQLVQIITYTGKVKGTDADDSIGTATMPVRDIILKKSGPSLGPRQNKKWKNPTMIIPPVPPTGLGGSKTIHVEYVLEVIMVVPHEANLVCEGNILIGTRKFDFAALRPIRPSKGSMNYSEFPDESQDQRSVFDATVGKD